MLLNFRSLNDSFSVYQSQKILHDNKSLKCRVGTEYPDKSGLTVSAIKVIFHPSYDPMTLENNLAIIKLKWSLNFKHSKNVMRVNYGKVEGALQRNLNAIIMIGWGDKVSQQFICQKMFTSSLQTS